jgi:hypothetical protein
VQHGRMAGWEAGLRPFVTPSGSGATPRARSIEPIQRYIAHINHHKELRAPYTAHAKKSFRRLTAPLVSPRPDFVLAPGPGSGEISISAKLGVGVWRSRCLGTWPCTCRVSPKHGLGRREPGAFGLASARKVHSTPSRQRRGRGDEAVSRRRRKNETPSGASCAAAAPPHYQLVRCAQRGCRRGCGGPLSR